VREIAERIRAVGEVASLEVTDEGRKSYNRPGSAFLKNIDPKRVTGIELRLAAEGTWPGAIKEKKEKISGLLEALKNRSGELGIKLEPVTKEEGWASAEHVVFLKKDAPEFHEFIDAIKNAFFPKK